MGKLKVLQFVKGSERYGASVSIKNLCGELRRRGHEVVLVVYKGRSLGPGMQDRGFRVVEIEPYGKFDIRAIRRAANLFQEERADIVHTHLSAATITGTIAARLSHVPVVSTVHGMNKRWTYSFADHLIAVSDAGKRNLVAQGVKAAKVSVAYNGIPMPAPSQEAARNKMRTLLGLPQDSLIIGSVSRADYGKGIQDGINAISMLRRTFPNLRYLVVGEGEYLPNLMAQAKALALADLVQFVGFREDVYEVLSAMDLFLSPSLKEAMGISIVEAMAMGLPVVGTDVGGIPEVVDADSGFLVPPHQAPILAGACSKLLADGVLRRTMGTAARERVRTRFSLQASAESVERVYEHVLGAKHGLAAAS